MGLPQNAAYTQYTGEICVIEMPYRCMRDILRRLLFRRMGQGYAKKRNDSKVDLGEQPCLIFRKN